MAGDKQSQPGFKPLRLRKESEEYHNLRGFLRVYFRQLRRYLITGLMVWIPLIVTAWLTWWVISTVGFGLERFFANLVQRLQQLGEHWRALDFLTHFTYVPGFGFLIAVLLFLTTGFITRYIAGRKLIATGEWILGKIPFVNRVYNAAQQIRDVFTSRGGAVVHGAVLFEYPRKGLWTLGLVTSTDEGTITSALGEGEHIAVFVATTPNPTSGFLLYLERKDVIPLDISVEDAMKVIVSGGAFMPGKKQDILASISEDEDDIQE